VAARRAVLGVGVAPLDHEAGDHAVERRPVVEALAGEVEEVLDVAGSLVGEELDLDLAEAGRKHGAGSFGAGHGGPSLQPPTPSHVRTSGPPACHVSTEPTRPSASAKAGHARRSGSRSSTRTPPGRPPSRR